MGRHTETPLFGRKRTTPGLIRRILTGQLLALAAGALTAAVVAFFVGPALFRRHVLGSGGAAEAGTGALDAAYREASLTSLGLALGAALLVTAALSWAQVRRLHDPVQIMVNGARQVASGHHAVHVPAVGSVDEFDTISGAFNAMASRLDGADLARRRALGDLARQLRTPVATLEAVHEGAPEPTQPRDAFTQRVLTTHTDRLAELLDEFREASTLGAATPLQTGTHDVDDLLHSAQQELLDAYTACGVPLFVRPAQPLGLTIDVDRDLFEELMFHLLAHALHVAPRGGTVTVTAYGTDEQVRIHVTEGTPADSSGSGGSGRAGSDRLRISEDIALAHGGTLRATSGGATRGQTLTLTLPTDVGVQGVRRAPA